MPLPLAAIPLIASGVSALGKVIAGATAKDDTPRAKVSASTREATAMARRRAGETLTPQEKEMRRRADKMFAETSGQVKRLGGGQSGMQSGILKANAMRGEMEERATAIGEQETLRNQMALTHQLGRQGQEEREVEMENRKREQEFSTARRNLFGSAYSDLTEGVGSAVNLDLAGTLYGLEGVGFNRKNRRTRALA